MNQTFTVTVDVPNGYESAGEYRPPRTGEYYLGVLGSAVRAESDIAECCFILRQAWQPPIWLPIDTWLYYNNEQWKITNRQPRMRAGERFPSACTGSTTMNVTQLAALMGQEWVSPPNSNVVMYQI